MRHCRQWLEFPKANRQTTRGVLPRLILTMSEEFSSVFASGAAAAASSGSSSSSAAAGGSSSAAAAAGGSSGSAAPAAAPPPDPAHTEVLVCGSFAHSLTGRSQAPAAGGDGIAEDLRHNFHRFAPLSGKRIVALYSGCTAAHYFAADDAGRLYAWGRNERGQLGLGDTRNRYVPTLVPGLGPVLAAAAGKAHSIVVCAGGEVWTAGDNSKGQCGLGKATDTAGGMYPRFTRAVGVPAGAAPSVAAGEATSYALAGGVAYAAGSQQYGACGTGGTGEYIVQAGKNAFRENLSFAAVAGPHAAAARYTAVAAGACHAVALAADGIPHTWGFGGYGRLGLGNVADALVPTPVKYFEANERLVRTARQKGAAHCCKRRTFPSPPRTPPLPPAAHRLHRRGQRHLLLSAAPRQGRLLRGHHQKERRGHHLAQELL